MHRRHGRFLARLDGRWLTAIGGRAMSVSNVAVVFGAGSLWSNQRSLTIGESGNGNRINVSDGARVDSRFGILGSFISVSNNEAVVTGPGSSWTSGPGELFVGYRGRDNRLLISDGGTLFAGSAIYAGFEPTSTGNRLTVDGGTLRTTNASATGTLDVRRGTNVLNAGLVEADRLLVTNTLGQFDLNGGTVSVRNSTVNNAQPFRVGNGLSPATLALTGNGAHSFANGLTVSANATLTGNGTVSGILSVQTSGSLAPGASIGKMVLSNSPSLQGGVVMEISKNPDPSGLTNDQIQVTAPLTYGGALIVSNLGPTALAAGDRFQLFNATGYAGIFSALSLPKAGTGLNWANRLLLDGSIEVVTWAGLRFNNVTRFGTNLILGVTDGVPGGAYDLLTATNILLPLTNWITLSSGTFDSFGNATVTNGIAPGEPARFFRIRVP